MVKRSETRFAGYECVKLENEALARGGSISHREMWTAHAGASIDDVPDRRGENRA